MMEKEYTYSEYMDRRTGCTVPKTTEQTQLANETRDIIILTNIFIPNFSVCKRIFSDIQGF